MLVTHNVRIMYILKRNVIMRKNQMANCSLGYLVRVKLKVLCLTHPQQHAG